MQIRSSDAPVPALTLLWCVLCCLPLVAINLAIVSTLGPLCDFVTYWSAARLFLAHQNPYDPHLVLTVQRSMGWPLPGPLVMFCPPWTLPIVAASGLLPFATARILWLALSLSLDVFSGLALWRYFGGAWRQSWIAVAVMLSFAPLESTGHMGQITPLMLAALTAFLWLVRKQRWWAAGLCMIGFSPKPHLLWLLFLAILVQILRERRWQLLAGGAAGFAALTATALVFDPAASHYFGNIYGAAVTTDCGVGGLLRELFGAPRTWLQYLPCLAGGLWFVWRVRRNRTQEHRAWNWAEDLPLLLLVSIASSPYCWFRDYILALPAFIALAVRGAWRSPRVLAAWLALQGLILAVPGQAVKASVSVLWIGFWLLASRESSRASVVSRSGGYATPLPLPATDLP